MSLKQTECLCAVSGSVANLSGKERIHLVSERGNTAFTSKDFFSFMSMVGDT